MLWDFDISAILIFLLKKKLVIAMLWRCLWDYFACTWCYYYYYTTTINSITITIIVLQLQFNFATITIITTGVADGYNYYNYYY